MKVNRITKLRPTQNAANITYYALSSHYKCEVSHNWRASKASETLSGGVQIRAGAVYVCIYIYVCMEVHVLHATHT